MTGLFDKWTRQQDWTIQHLHVKRKGVHISLHMCFCRHFSCNSKLKSYTFIALHHVKRLIWVSMMAQGYKVKFTSELPVGRAGFMWGCSEHRDRSCTELHLQLLGWISCNHLVIWFLSIQPDQPGHPQEVHAVIWCRADPHTIANVRQSRQ